ncbi:hypothetical protein OS190_09545 [Sulfitobacter sp. F26204]|uniref:hypothetical protein n=1 Tax=Sulfitobacter sp. F26204 TaxID=2996014 RepID=UPI00225DDECF|nr:hypothetical protein [Sulfitobacter sp. F26204]MCX7559810.1 hypothetical protein [Sulfitobacter sp. F26204]
MRGLLINVAIATVTFFAITLAWRGTGDLTTAGFSAVVFALIYGAIQVGIVVFRGDKT